MEFKLENIKVYGLEESIIASGWPKSIAEPTYNENRARKLGSAKPGSGHDNFLRGIIVQADLTASHAFYMQYERYTFANIVSSQSKMHKITEMDLCVQCNSFVKPEVIEICDMLKLKYLLNKSQENFETLIANLPLGLMLTARVTDNYLSLKTQYFQRKTDKLVEWEQYLKVVAELPMFTELCLNSWRA